jgi:hypothetical protein
LRESIEVRCVSEGMSSEVADPIVLIIDGDEQDIGFTFCEGIGGEPSDEAEDRGEKGGAHVGL